MLNRVYQTAHCSRHGSPFPGAQAHPRGMKDEGGWTVVNTEYRRDWVPATVAPLSIDNPDRWCPLV